MAHSEPEWPILDEAPARNDLSYALPPEQMDRAVALANHLATREAVMPLRRRMASYLEATGRASLTPQ